jgi:Ca2+-binding RTX toxin-like protein
MAMVDTPPKLTNLKLSTNTVDLSGGAVNLTFTATGTDDVGITDLSLDFGFANGSSFLGGTASIFHSPFWPNGQFSASESVSQNTHDGPYHITGAVLFDTAGHQVSYTEAQLQALGVNTVITVTHSDTTGPTLQALTLPSTVNPGGPLTITASATDPAGVKMVVVDFNKNITAGGTGFDLFGNDDSWADGTSTHTETLPLNTPGGVYTIADIKLYDNLQNVTTLTTSQLTALGFRTTVTVNPGDTTPPALTNLSFPATVNVSGGSKAVTFLASGTDNATGVADVRIHFDKDLTTGSTAGGLVDITGNTDSWADGSSSIAQTIPTSAKAGVYTVTSVDVFDGAGNEVTYSNAQLQAAHFSTTLTITSNPQDTTPPDLQSLTFPTSVDLSSGEKFMDWFVTAHDSSGIGSLTVWFDHAIGMDFGSIAYYPGFILDGTTGDSWSDGGSSGRLVLPTSDAFDLVFIDHIDLYDTLGNLHTYTGSDLASLGFQTGFVLFNNQVDVQPVDVIMGTPLNDNLHGGPNNNFIGGGPGDDNLTCGGGSDFLDGGPGNDSYFIISSSDVIIDTVSDGGFDSAFVSVSYVLSANASIEYLATMDATSTVAISLTGNSFSQTIVGNAGDNVIFGGDGSDTLIGGDGNDTLVGNDNIFLSETDTLNGGNGNDILYVESSDIISGGAGRDFVYVVNDNAIHIDMGATSIEWISSGFGSDVIDASTQTVGVEIYSDGGNDTITGSAFDDIIWSGSGNDTVVGGDGNDVIVGDIGADSISGGNGNDSLYVDASDTFIDGGAGFDAAYITGGSMSINMAATHLEWVADFVDGNDTIDGSGTSVNLEVYAAGGTDTVIGGSGNDFLWGGAGDDIVIGNSGNDVLVGGTGADRLTGGPGIDALYGNSGNGGDGAVDTFVFTPNWGTDFVFDFEHGLDKLDLTAVGITFADLTLTNTSDGHCYVSFGSNLICVANHTTANLTASDFLF